MRQLKAVGVALLLVAGFAAAAAAQPYEEQWGRPVLRIGQGYTLRAGDRAREVVVIFGDATIEGRVDHNVVVILGKVELASTADIDGSLVVVGGSAKTAAEARVRDNLVVVAGGLDAPAGFSPGDQYIVIGPTILGGRMDALVPWLTRGLLWGRPIVPDIWWVWRIVAVFFLVYLALNLIFDSSVRACASTLSHRPLTAFVTGLLVLLLVGPVSVLLAVSVIGIAVIPFLLCALLVAAMIGKVGLARWMGSGIVGDDPDGGRIHAVIAFAIGFAIITLAYTIPILGFVVWTLVGVIGLGASTLTFIAAYRRENPAAAKKTPPPETPQPPSQLRDEPQLPSTDLHLGQATAFSTPSEPTPTYSSSSPVGRVLPEPRLVVTATSAAAAIGEAIGYPHAMFRDRLAAFVLDVLLIAIAKEMLAWRQDPDVFFVLLLGYHIAFWTWKQTTVGGIICQLRVVRTDGGPLTFADALVRGLASIFSLAVLGIGCLWILRDPERQAWHDRIAGTYVVKVPRNFPL